VIPARLGGAVPAALAPWLAAAFMAALFGVFTARVGWSAVPVVAFACGVTTAWVGPRVPAGGIGAAAAVGWGILLTLRLVARGAGAVPPMIGSLTGLGPATGTAAAALVTLALAFALAWSAAALGQALVALGRRRRRAVDAVPEPPVVAPPGGVTLPPRHAAAPPAGSTSAAPP
jgi:hypothetical protein